MSMFGELRWNVLETFAKVTRAAEELQDRVLNLPVTQQVLPYISPTIENIDEGPNSSITRSRNYGSPNSPIVGHITFNGLDETARLYLSRWAAGIVERASSEIPLRLNSSVFRQNNVNDNNQIPDFWGAQLDTEVGAFELWQENPQPGIEFICMTREPLSPIEWLDYFKLPELNTVILGESKFCDSIKADPKIILKRIFMGGVDHDIRPEVWKYILKVYPWNSTDSQRKAIQEDNRKRYWKLKHMWMDPNIRATEDYKLQESRIEKDVLRTDRHIELFSANSNNEEEPSERGLPTSNAAVEQLKDILLCYHYHNQSLGYVQGMSDLLSPIYAVMQDEVDAFWCFTKFMEKVEPNFYRDQKIEINGDNMFACFRWLLIWYKREFSFENIMRVWEVIWTNYACSNMHLFMALAILEIHQHVIITHLRGLDELLKYINDLSGAIDYRTVLRRAELMFREFEGKISVHISRQQQTHSNGSGDATNTHADTNNNDSLGALSDSTSTPLIITPPPEVHSFTASPNSPAMSGISPVSLTLEELDSLRFIIE